MMMIMMDDVKMIRITDVRDGQDVAAETRGETGGRVLALSAPALAPWLVCE